jgi:glycosyltransferase involved in cell wall biosynthesis
MDTGRGLTPEQADATYVIIMAYNEARVIREVVERVLAVGVRVVVVDDASTDGTLDQLGGLPICALRHAVNLGQGAAIQTGVDFAVSRGARYLVTFDGDGQHDEDDIPKLIRELEDGDKDVVLASRFLGKEATGMKLTRRMLLQAVVLYTRWTTALPLTDAHNGFRAFRAEVAPSLRITQNRMAHASELLQKIAVARLRYAEVPSVVHYSDYSRAKGQTGLGAVDILFDLFVRRFFR